MKISIFRFWSHDKVYKMETAIDSHCEMYKRPYMLNRSTYFHKTCCKKVPLSKNPSSEAKLNLCGPFSLTFIKQKQYDSHYLSLLVTLNNI